jgi:putative oxidoreductase
MRNTFGAERFGDVMILAGRILLVILFVMFGWEKLVGFNGTIAYFSAEGVPLPFVAAVIAVMMEFFAGLAIALGFLTRPLALLLAIYTFGTAILGHPFWNMSDGARFANEINFFKNVSIIGGFLLLYVIGAGRYAIDEMLGLG